MQTWDGKQVWVVTRYEDGRAILADERFSVDPTVPGFPEKNIAYLNTIGQDRNIRTIDNPEHDRQKRMMIQDFTVKRVAEIRPAVQTLVDQLIDDMLEREAPVDLIEHLAIPVPTTVICELLGVPYSDRDFFGERAKALLAAPTAEAAKVAGAEMTEYVEHLIDLKIAKAGNDLVSRMVHQHVLPGTYARADLVSLCRLLLTAGHDTTTGMIGLSVLALLRHPDQLRELKESDDPAFVANCVEEFLRYLGTTHAGRRRVALTDVEVAGHTIHANEGVIVLNNVMDRDDAVFADPNRLDLHRTNTRVHTAFGYGIHQCPGQLLARMELHVVHSTLWKRVPTLTLAVPMQELHFFEDGSNYEVTTLPVTW
ncbi:cytochrome P450 [Amycolatopsis sp. K13G38]|uniref:Cytochrome P450 n=2 Tax=Amycolatopsis acididurans TaxID=2724524 RepID=A0ABX1J8M3_9PSEU|nr:cytochrome P450 [Amycolatopsis acididurans]